MNTRKRTYEQKDDNPSKIEKNNIDFSQQKNNIKNEYNEYQNHIGKEWRDDCLSKGMNDDDIVKIVVGSINRLKNNDIDDEFFVKYKESDKFL